MVDHTIPHPADVAQERVRQLLGQIRVTNLETGAPLPPQAKLGRVIAACRGHIPTLVAIDWGQTSATEVRAALDALRRAQ